MIELSLAAKKVLLDCILAGMVVVAFNLDNENTSIEDLRQVALFAEQLRKEVEE